MGRVNNSFAWNKKEKLARRGKFYSSIDFDVADLPESTMKQRKTDTVLGQFIIGKSKFDLTHAEINQIIETLSDAKQVIDRKFRLGLYK